MNTIAFKASSTLYRLIRQLTLGLTRTHFDHYNHLGDYVGELVKEEKVDTKAMTRATFMMVSRTRRTTALKAS